MITDDMIQVMVTELLIMGPTGALAECLLRDGAAEQIDAIMLQGARERREFGEKRRVELQAEVDKAEEAARCRVPRELAPDITKSPAKSPGKLRALVQASRGAGDSDDVMVSTPVMPDWTSDEGVMQKVRQMAAEAFTGVMTQMIAEAGDRDYEKGWLIENCSAEMRGQYQGAWAQLKFLEAAVVGVSDHPMDQYDAGTTAIGDFGSEAGRAESEQSEEDWPEPIWKSMNHEQRRNWLQRRRRRSVKSKRSEDLAEDNGRQSSEKPSSTQQQLFPGELSSSRR